MLLPGASHDFGWLYNLGALLADGLRAGKVTRAGTLGDQTEDQNLLRRRPRSRRVTPTHTQRRSLRAARNSLCTLFFLAANLVRAIAVAAPLSCHSVPLPSKSVQDDRFLFRRTRRRRRYSVKIPHSVLLLPFANTKCLYHCPWPSQMRALSSFILPHFHSEIQQGG